MGYVLTMVFVPEIKYPVTCILYSCINYILQEDLMYCHFVSYG